MSDGSRRLPPVIQVVGYKNSGKTTVVCGLVASLRARGLRVGTAKHDAHEAELDRPGKDTWQHWQAGADATAFSSPARSAIWVNGERSLSELVAHMPKVDLVVAEGFKTANYPKWVLLRSPDDLPLVEQVSQPVGISAWFPLQYASLPVVALDDYVRMADCILSILRFPG